MYIVSLAAIAAITVVHQNEKTRLQFGCHEVALNVSKQLSETDGISSVVLTEGESIMSDRSVAEIDRVDALMHIVFT